MIKYSKEDMLNIIQSMEEWPDGTYKTVAGSLRDLYDQGLFDYGFSKQGGSQGSAEAIKELSLTYPDVLYAFFMPKREMPLYVGCEPFLETPIVTWRLKSQTESSYNTG